MSTASTTTPTISRTEVRRSIASHRRPYAIAQTHPLSADVLLMLSHDLGHPETDASRTAIATAKAAAGIRVKSLDQNNQVLCLRISRADAYLLAATMEGEHPLQAAAFRTQLDRPLDLAGTRPS